MQNHWFVKINPREIFKVVIREINPFYEQLLLAFSVSVLHFVPLKSLQISKIIPREIFQNLDSQK